MGDSVVVCCARSMWTNFCWIVFLLSSSVTFAESRHHHHQLASNFVSVNYLPDGRIETRVHYNGISAKETTIANRNNSGSIIRELTDGKRFIKLVYNNNGTLKNCNFGRRKERIRSLMQVFEDEEDQSHMRNSIIDDDRHANRTAPTSSIVLQRLDDSKPLPMNVRKWFDYPKLRRMCRKKKKQRKQQKKKQEDKQNFKLNFDDSSRRSERRPPNRDSLVMMPGTLWCGDRDVAPTYNALGLFAETDRCCRRHDFCRKNIYAYNRKYELLNERPFTISHCFCDASSVSSVPGRDLLGDLLRIPGTHWCGKGYSATRYTQLGLFSRTDRCCRTHDLACPFWIGGLETKYGLHNFRANTLMHCSCDERFRACLKMVGTTDANIVGNIFFNFVQTKCFVIKRKRICAEWEGKKCVRKETVKRAVLRTNLSY